MDCKLSAVTVRQRLSSQRGGLQANRAPALAAAVCELVITLGLLIAWLLLQAQYSITTSCQRFGVHDVPRGIQSSYRDEKHTQLRHTRENMTRYGKGATPFTACSENLVVRHFVKKKIGWHPANSAEGQHSHWLCVLSVLHISAALAASQKYVAAQRNPTCRVVECAQACMTGIVGRQRFNFSDSV
jgi:hypothetical protein